MALKLGELVAYLRGDDKQLDKTMKEAHGKLRSFGDKARRYGPVIGAAMAAGIGAGLLGGMDLDAARAKLTAQVGDPALAARLGEAAGAAYGRGFGADATEAMTAARSVMQAGLLPKGADAAVIEDLTVKAQTLATTFDLDVTQAARAAGQMVKTGLAGNAAEAFDILTRTMQVTGDQAGDLLDTVTEYSTQFREVGISGPKAMGLLAQAAKAGARDLDTAADAIKEFAIRSQDGTERSAEGFKLLNLNAKQMTATFAKGGPEADKAMKLVLDRLKAMKDPVEQRAAAVALFGTKAEDLGDALYALDPTTAVAGLGELAGATDKAGKALEETSAQKLEAFKRQAQQALVQKLAEAVPYIEKTFGWLQRNSDWVVPLVGGLAALAAVIYTITTAMKVWTVVQTVLNLALWTSPITWIVLGIIALVAVIVLIATKTTWFQTAWKWAWGGIKKSAHAVGDWFVNTLWKRWILGAYNGIIGGGKRFLAWYFSLPGRLRRALVNVGKILLSPFRWGFNQIARLWNRTVGRLSFRAPSWLPGGLAGKGWSMPHLPMLAKGGTALAPGLAVVGERGPELAYLNRGATVQPLASGSAAAGLMRLLLTGEFRIRGSDLVLVLRDRVALDGGDVQEVLGS